ncbi:MAG: hypothetical protein QOJ59_1613 [Thermomicrobiales bacterium]|nr:hypothetical protein [Thermomicrobiales bacterium]
MARRRPCLPTTLILILVALLASTVGAGVRSVAAEDTSPGLTVKAEPGTDPATTARGYFVYALASGTRATGEVRLANPTDHAISADLAAVDAITANNGGSAFGTGEVGPTAVGTWLTLDTTRVTMQPGKDHVVGFTVRVPKNATPGQYLAGLAVAARPDEGAATPVTADANQAGATIDLRVRYVIGVEVDVAGEWTPSLQIDDVHLIAQPSGPVLGIDLRNDGATFLQPTGSLTVTNAAGSILIQHPIAMGTFVTGTEVTYPIAWPGGPVAGTYNAHVALAYGDDQTATYDGTFTVGDDVAAMTVSTFAVTEARDPASDELQYVDVRITIDNPAAAVPNARLTLHVTRDGQPVEDVVLGSSLTIQAGPGEVSQRYFPPGGWTSGTYAFAVTIETVDPSSGQAIVILTADAITTIVVP